MNVPDLDMIKEKIRARQSSSRESSAQSSTQSESFSNQPPELECPDPHEVLKWLLAHQYDLTRSSVEEGVRGVSVREKELLLKVAVAAIDTMTEEDPAESFDVESLTIKDLQTLREAMGIGTPSKEK